MQDGDGVHLRGGGAILDQFDQLVAVDHLARGDRQVFAHLERLGIGDLDLAFLEVAQ